MHLAIERRDAFLLYCENASNNKLVAVGDHNNGGFMKSKENKPFIRVFSETLADDGFVDCVWEMPIWFANKLETEAKKTENYGFRPCNTYPESGFEGEKGKCLTKMLLFLLKNRNGSNFWKRLRAR